MATTQLKTRLLAVAVITASAMIGCNDGQTPPAGREAKGGIHLGGTLRTVENGRPLGLFPEDMANVAGYRIGNQIHLGLTRLDPISLEPMPGLAERIDTDTSGRAYMFHLRQGMKFHAEPCLKGNREVTANDVAFSLHLLCRPASPAFNMSLKGRIEGADAYHEALTDNISGIRVLDDYTLQITLTRPDESFLHILAQPVAGVISRRGWEDCDAKPIGAGPFIPFITEEELLLLRHEDYFAIDAFGNQLPYLDTVRIAFIRSKELALERMLEGDLDLVTGVYIDPVRSLMDKNAKLFTGPDAVLMMQRNDDVASYEVFAIHSARLKGFRDNFLGHRDYAVVQIIPKERM
jgi:oligopeptide transport system substrate-binding protein